jgi:hypothetical protein
MSATTVFSVNAQTVFKFSGHLLKEELIIESLLASLKTVTNFKDCSESRIRISVPAFLCRN